MASRRVCTMATLAAVVIAVSLWSGSAEAQTLRETIAAKETALDRLALRASAAYSGRCATLSGCVSGSTQCTIPACGSDFPSNRGFNCTSNYGTAPDVCGASCSGMVRSTTASTVRIPPSTSFTNAEVQAFVCSSNVMTNEFITQHQNGNGPLKAWSYVAHSSGSIRTYPGSPQGRSANSCDSYDARLRPWYIAASSGPKDIVFVLDKSGSMSRDSGVNGRSRWSLMVEATATILDTLTQNDFVSIVLFDSASFVLGGRTRMIRADAAGINALKSELNAAGPGGGTDFTSGFTRAFPLFTSSVEETSRCTRVMVFLTDGIAGDSESSQDAAIANGQASLRAFGNQQEARIFTFSMSSGSDDTRPRRIACANGGVWAKIADGENPLNKMTGYYNFLASGIDSTTVRWTTPYIDSFGLGRMVTGGRAIYDRSGAVPVLVGVAATDVTMTELEQYGSFSSVVSELISRSNVCPALNLTDCQIQHLREQSGYRCPGTPTAAACANAAEIAQPTSCSSQGSLNDYFCTNLGTTSRIATSGSQSTAAVSCCGTGCNGATSSSIFAAIAVVTVAIAASLF